MAGPGPASGLSGRISRPGVRSLPHNRAVSESRPEGRTELVAGGGVELFVRRFGDPALPMLIVVHGGPTWDHSYLLPAAAGLDDLAHVVLFDLRGCGRSSRTPPVGDLPVAALQPDLLADDVAALIRHYGAARADVLGFSYGGGVAMRLVDQHPGMVRSLILASTTAYGDYEQDREASGDYQARAQLRTKIAWDDPALTGPDSPDGALSRAMAYTGAPCDIWRLDRLDDWHRILAGVRFSSDWNAPYAAGQLQPARPDRAESVLRSWARPILILHGLRDLTFPVSLARKLHAALPASTLAEIPDAAHMAHFDNLHAWLASVRGFLRATR
jgi:pimeloyl-ACP methyl ester carboxylesterase